MAPARRAPAEPVAYQLEEEGCLVGLEGGLGICRRGWAVDVILGSQGRGCRELLDELHGGMLVVQIGLGWEMGFFASETEAGGAPVIGEGIVLGQQRAWMLGHGV